MARQRARHIAHDESETLSFRVDPKQGAPFGDSRMAAAAAAELDMTASRTRMAAPWEWDPPQQ